MTRTTGSAAALAFALAFGSSPAPAAISLFDPPTIAHRADTSVAIAGSGSVVVQVEVLADGNHHVIKVIRSTNPGDNEAALDIARKSTYRAATRNGKAETAFYDFTIRFVGTTVAADIAGENIPVTASGTSVMNTPTVRINELIHSGKYADAKAMIEQGLATNPDDATLNQQLGTADYFSHDYAGASAAFGKVPTVSKMYADVAAQSFVLAAVDLAKDPSTAAQAIPLAQKAIALNAGANAYYALGLAQLQSGDATNAAVSLKRAHDLIMNDSKVTTDTKVAIDTQLLNAYLKVGNSTGASQMTGEIQQLNPNSPVAKVVQANHFIQMGNDDSKAGKHQQALADFQQAADVGDSSAKVIAFAAMALEQSSISQSQKTQSVADYAKVKGYADQALAIDSQNPLANFAEGIGLSGEYIVGGGSNAGLKAQALAALNKAKALAQAAGNVALSLNIDNFIKQTFK